MDFEWDETKNACNMAKYGDTAYICKKSNAGGKETV